MKLFLYSCFKLKNKRKKTLQIIIEKVHPRRDDEWWDETAAFHAVDDEKLLKKVGWKL